jgi:hypothetical protein
MKTNNPFIGLSGHEYAPDEVAHCTNWHDLQLLNTWRNPTASELRFGEGMVRHMAMPVALFSKPNGTLKRWVKFNGKRYNRFI